MKKKPCWKQYYIDHRQQTQLERLLPTVTLTRVESSRISLHVSDVAADNFMAASGKDERRANPLRMHAGYRSRFGQRRHNPLDFTLHDANHSFRVAQRAASLLPDDILSVLTVFDAAQLLLASYLHDIGMTPGRRLAGSHWNFLLSGRAEDLTKPERVELQRWLDGHYGGLTPPLDPAVLNDHGIRRIEEVFAYYSRFKHNDWSEVWIREHLEDTETPLYHNWIDDLITICRSHHEGLHELRTNRFNLRIVGTGEDCLNPRYVAALLRISDVLEFDPERTPPVIFKHRQIAPSSKIFWQKDHSISFNMDPKDHSLLFTARTPNASVHRAVLDTLSGVNAELLTCSILAHEGHLKMGSAPSIQKDRYNWSLPSQLKLDVREKDDSFVYIDGGFRPDKTKILNLLSGTNLYGSRLAALRELVQNAIDAVREQIALERLQRDDAADKKWEQIFGLTHRIRLTLEVDNSSCFLTCADDGVGMDKNLIENHLLVSGAQTRGDLVALERNARTHNFKVGRTGQFGIGLLSYFMIADSISVSTRRSAEAGDSDGFAWRFSIDGLDSFGELAKESRASKGTTVTLKLQKDFVGDDSDKLFEEIKRYLLETVKFAPCEIEIVNASRPEQKVTLPYGWTATKDALADTVIAGFYSARLNDTLVTDAEKEAQRHSEDRWAKIKTAAKTRLQLAGPFVKELPEGRGMMRGWLPFFDYGNSKSLFFLDFVEDSIGEMPSSSEMISPAGFVRPAWRGFAASNVRSRRDASNIIIEYNCIDDGEIAVDRMSFKVDFDIVAECRRFSLEILQNFFDEESGGGFSLLNMYSSSKLGIAATARMPDGPYWAVRDAGKKKWEKITSKFVDVLSPKYHREIDEDYLKLGGVDYRATASLKLDKYDSLRISGMVGTGKLAFFRDGSGNYPAIYWDSPEEFADEDSNLYGCKFPDTWQDITMISTPQRPIFNRNAALFEGIILDQFSISANRVEELAQMVASKELSSSEARTLLAMHLNRGANFWNAFRDNFNDLFQRLISSAKLAPEGIRVWLFHGSYDSDVSMVLNANGARARDNASQGTSLDFADRFSCEFPSDWNLRRA